MNDPANVLSHDGLGNNPFDTNPRILAVAFRENAGVRYRLQLQNHALIARRVNALDELSLRIALERVELVAACACLSTESVFDVGECGSAVDAGLAAAEARNRAAAARGPGERNIFMETSSGCLRVRGMGMGVGAGRGVPGGPGMAGVARRHATPDDASPDASGPPRKAAREVQPGPAAAHGLRLTRWIALSVLETK